MRQINHAVIENIKKHFSFLLTEGFLLEVNDQKVEYWIARFYDQNCQFSFFEDRNEIFITLQSKLTSKGEYKLSQLFEIEVIIAYLTQFQVIVRGPNRSHKVGDVEEQIKHLGILIASYQDQILNTFNPEVFVTVLPELITAQDKIDKMYIEFIKSNPNSDKPKKI
jgi:hypothetical protein